MFRTLAVLAVFAIAVAGGYVWGRSDGEAGRTEPLTEPRLAVGYHFFNDFDVQPEVTRRVRKTYDTDYQPIFK